MGPSVAVIGATGFIGRRLIAALDRRGIPAARFDRTTPVLRAGRVAAEIREASVVFYLASTINPALAVRHPERIEQDHQRFAALLRRLPGQPTVVLSSSGGTVYDPDLPAPYHETTPARPVSAYGIAKINLERELLASAARPVILRIANVYGPGQRTSTLQGVVGQWLLAIRAGAPLRVFGDPRARRDYVYVDDVVRAMLRVYDLVVLGLAARIPRVLNIGSGLPVSLTDLAAAIGPATHCPVRLAHEPGRGFDRHDVWLDCSLAAHTLGWRVTTSLADGLARTWRLDHEPHLV
ncbi:NAD-dependent epimerase/dehydratase family protein [Crossiella sp. NPDC003009]